MYWWKYQALMALSETPKRAPSSSTLPPRHPRYGGDFTGERAVWEGKFCIE